MHLTDDMNSGFTSIRQCNMVIIDLTVNFDTEILKNKNIRVYLEEENENKELN